MPLVFFLLPTTLKVFLPVKISFAVNLSNSWWETNLDVISVCLRVPVNEKCRSGFWPKAGNH